MALINCPECGKENVSSSASACPNCGFDIKNWQKSIEAERIAKEKEETAKNNLKLMALKKEEERQNIINSIKAPEMYGDKRAYAAIAGGGLLLTIASSPIWLLLALAGCVVYYKISNLEYSKYASDPEGYRQTKAEEKIRITEAQNAAKTNKNEITTTEMKFCPKCGSEDITRQVFQENKGSKEITHTTSKYKGQGHGIIWWITIGWWWWIIDLFLWIFAFFPRLILRLFASPYKKKKYKGVTNSVTETIVDISYKTVCTCQNCGHTWS